ncbi:CPBP family intramembrane glutamic endopeptidase [Symbiobacterium thermophilum]|uniref:CAAX prenyl protease 2/Lysostaphin resistance protein A-like domain-containing protein n=2 Tax=Symbiobacterium thermophilum TaxID=2734 RepID=Q67LI7_SYMTH|nr:CPBP family intramembrane glutamic endopeptidase [Symbiobacterium thermophilum]MBY6275721.1 CPBP family intramembrane metalloprotease [Symbiobacterium thermophilum]BAD41459.1 conserved hypothetical protein [Symbiobacterium thermophilum IAM 14863]
MPADVLAGVALAVQSAIALYLVVGEPILGTRSYRRLLAILDSDPAARLNFYRKIVILEWALVFLVLVTLRLAGEPAAVIGLTSGRLDSEALILVIALAAGIAAPLIIGAFSPGYREALQRQMESVKGLLPGRPDERLWYALVAITAGVCEEILFRGFLIAYFMKVVPGLPVVAALILSGAVFGMAHLYQGWGGVMTTGFLGIMLGVLYLYTGSLVWPIVTHALLDLRVLALPGVKPPASQ